MNQFGCIFLQFTTFTYLTVRYFKGEPYTLPRYPTNRIILIELAKQRMEVQSYQNTLYKPSFGITIVKPFDDWAVYAQISIQGERYRGKTLADCYEKVQG